MQVFLRLVMICGKEVVACVDEFSDTTPEVNFLNSVVSENLFYSLIFAPIGPFGQILVVLFFKGLVFTIIEGLLVLQSVDCR